MQRSAVQYNSVLHCISISLHCGAMSGTTLHYTVYTALIYGFHLTHWTHQKNIVDFPVIHSEERCLEECFVTNLLKQHYIINRHSDSRAVHKHLRD